MDRFEGLNFHSIVETLESWQTEFETVRRYVQYNGLRFWECGRVDLMHSFSRSPDERRQLAKDTNISIYSSGDVFDFALVKPDGGRIPKVWMAEQCMLMFDLAAGLVVNADQVRGHAQISWLSPTAFPLGMLPLKFNIPDKVAEAAAWKELFDERWNEAQCLRELDAVPSDLSTDVEHFNDNFFENPTCRYAWVMRKLSGMSKGDVIAKYIRPKTNVKTEFEFLRFK